MICIKEIEAKQLLTNGFGLLETSTYYIVLARWKQNLFPKDSFK